LHGPRLSSLFLSHSRNHGSKKAALIDRRLQVAGVEMAVPERGLNIPVAGNFFDRNKVYSGHNSPAGARMPQRMPRHADDPGLTAPSFEGPANEGPRVHRLIGLDTGKHPCGSEQRIQTPKNPLRLFAQRHIAALRSLWEGQREQAYPDIDILPAQFEEFFSSQSRFDRQRRQYNTQRPHSALGYRPPAPETRTFAPVSVSA
jgi:hypothetical protein